MASYHVAAVNSLRTSVATAWTDCPANGILLPIQMRNNLEAKLAKGQVPFAVLDVQFSEEGWSAHEQEDAGNCFFYYVVTDGTSWDGLVTKLETLRDYLYDTGATDACIINNPICRYDMGLPLNQYFFATRTPLFAGAVVARVHIAEAL